MAGDDSRQNPDSASTYTRRVIRFGVFELDSQTGELRKRGVKLKLQGKPLQVLQALLERPGELVTREQLRRHLWPSDVFIDFDSGLNTAANRLRLALGDSAENPRYIETLARAGYRFIAPIVVVDTAAPPATSTPHPARRSVSASALAAAAALVLITIAVLVASRTAPAGGLEFQQVTFRGGQVAGARFTSDGSAILYTASRDNGRRQLFLTNPGNPESRALGFEDLRLVSVSKGGELALLAVDGVMPITGGTLFRAPMNGSVPKPVAQNVMSADWSPDGQLAIARAVSGTNQLEFPPGRVIHKTAGWIGSIRFSRSGNLAFIEHPVRHDNRGTLTVMQSDGTLRTLGTEWANAGGLVWPPAESEIWLTASRDGSPKSLWAVSMAGYVRPLAQIAGAMTIRDVAPDGRVLVSSDTQQLEMAAVMKGEPEQRKLTWHDWTRVVDITRDGQLILFDETGVAGGAEYLIYLHRTTDRSTMRVGNGLAMAFAPEGTHVLALGADDRSRLRLIPLSEGPATELPPSGLDYQWARYFPDGRRLLALANEPGQPLRLYVQPPDGKPMAITPPGTVRNVATSPDGETIAPLSAAGELMLYPTTGVGAGRKVPSEEPLAPLLWTTDDWLYVQHIGAFTQIPTRLSRLHLPSGTLVPWLEVAPTDPLGVNAITKVMVSPDARTVVFNYRRVLSELFVAEPRR